jgi:hypothetical protein
MKVFLQQRGLWWTWSVVMIAFIVFAALPVSNGFTRAGTLATFGAAWGLLMAVTWRRRWIRGLLVTSTAACFLFLVLPGKSHRDSELLRKDFAVCLRRYDGVRYFWGGEGFTGIDCSGLIRRGLIDALVLRGIRTLDPGLVRQAAWLWWHDCSASDLGEGQHGLTVSVLETPSINALDHSRLVLGDLAMGGGHIMAYLGDQLWIEADPGIGRVIIVRVPSEKNPWFHNRMKIVRWSVLNP